jgi:hypothetical protein
MKEDRIIENEISLKLKREQLETILSIFHYFLISFCDEYTDTELDREAAFIKNFIDSILPTEHKMDSGKLFIDNCRKERIRHIEWLFGADNGGEPEFTLPDSYEKMKDMLINYDMLWLG